VDFYDSFYSLTDFTDFTDLSLRGSLGLPRCSRQHKKICEIRAIREKNNSSSVQSAPSFQRNLSLTYRFAMIARITTLYHCIKIISFKSMLVSSKSSSKWRKLLSFGKKNTVFVSKSKVYATSVQLLALLFFVTLQTKRREEPSIQTE